MYASVSRYSLAVRVLVVLLFVGAIVNTALLFWSGLIPMENATPFNQVWLSAINILNALLVVGVAFMAADAGLGGGPGDAGARGRLLELTQWLPAVAVAIACLPLVSPSVGALVGDKALATTAPSLRAVIGQLIPLGWALFGWAAVLRWLKQGPGWTLQVLTRVMEVLTLSALALDVSSAFVGSLASPESILGAMTRALDAVTQGLAVVACVEAVVDPRPERLNGLLGLALRILAVLAWLVLVLQAGQLVLGLAVQPAAPLYAYAGTLSSLVGWLLSFSERQLLAATLWAREQRLAVGR